MAFVADWWVVLATLGGLALVGGWTLVPLRDRGSQVLYAAPALGLIIMVVGVGTLYSELRLKLTDSAVIVAVLSSGLSACALWHERRRLRLNAFVPPLVLGIAVATILTRVLCDTTWRINSPGLLYFDGTDHLGYAQMGDWLLTHTVLQQPRADPSVPYQSFPEILFRVDTRFGSFEWLGIVSFLTNHPGAFAYDVACAIVLSAGILGLCGLFARSRWMAVALAAGLLTSHWFDYASTGYFGKVMGFPAAILVGGIFVTSRGPIRLPEVGIMLLCVAGTSIMYSGLVTAFLVATVGVPFVVCEALILLRKDQRLSQLVKDRAIVLGLLTGVASLTTGFASRPGNYAFPDYNLDWAYIVPRVLDLENQGVSLSGLTAPQVLLLCAVFAVVVIVAIALAISRQLSVAFCLIGGPAMLLVALFATNARATTFQLIGTVYPLVLCGLAVLIENAPPTRRLQVFRPAMVSALSVGLFAVLAISHVPRFAGSLARYAGSNAPESVRFSLGEIDTISSLVGTSTVEVDTIVPQSSIMALVELGRRGINVQWTPRAWASILSYRPWPAPAYSEQAAFCVSAPEAGQSSALYTSPRYELVVGPCRITAGPLGS